VDLWIEAREGGHHSGNWGGLLSNPAIELAHAIGTIVGPKGQIRIPEWVPDGIPDSVKRALEGCDIHSGQGSPAIDLAWGEPGLSSAEKVFAWSTFEILAMSAGNPEAPVNAVPPKAWARGQLRFVVEVDPDEILLALRRHLDRHGFAKVQIAKARDEIFYATRLDRTIPGRNGPRRRSHARPARGPQSCRARAARSPTTYSRNCSACRSSGCRIPIPDARSTPRTSTCRSCSRARVCG